MLDHSRADLLGAERTAQQSESRRIRAETQLALRAVGSPAIDGRRDNRLADQLSLLALYFACHMSISFAPLITVRWPSEPVFGKVPAGIGKTVVELLQYIVQVTVYVFELAVV